MEFGNPSVGYVKVVKDGFRNVSYGLPLEPWVMFRVDGDLFFSRDENLIALTYGSPSYGIEVLIYGRRGKERFKMLKTNLTMRCWEFIQKKGLVPKKANLSHMYVDLDKALEHGFQMSIGGNYSGSSGQTNFGVYHLVWNRPGNELTLIATDAPSVAGGHPK